MKKQIASIGLEMHCELKSNSKVFSEAQNTYSETPNSSIAPLDMGHFQLSIKNVLKMP